MNNKIAELKKLFFSGLLMLMMMSAAAQKEVSGTVTNEAGIINRSYCSPQKLYPGRSDGSAGEIPIVDSR